MKHISFLFLLFSAFLTAQKLQVVDAENGKPIANARIILINQLVYTNEDGFAPVNENSKDFEVSASGFKKVNVKNFSSIIKLQPAFKDIEEVKIINVDIKKIIEDLHKNYNKRYFDKPSLYDITFKSKGFNNNNLIFMVIAEAKLWSKSNSYNFRDGYKKNYDEILQIQLNNVKYKKDNLKGIFNVKTNEFEHASMGDYFFSFEIYRLLANMNTKNSKITGRLISEDNDTQVIYVKVQSERGIDVSGEITYNKIDKVITLYNLIYQQENFPIYKKTNKDGVEFDYQLGNASVLFDFYKKDGIYIPASKKVTGEKFFIIHDGKKDERSFSTEIVYNTFTKSNKKGLESKVDFNKSIWDNVPVKEDKEATILLSKEEQEFINQK
ncbi:carboxypeptidase-like regulatory domain-containing protein [Chryseobacterium turcicum]|uniref:Carboxypeptidase-like regulatory domain-containing protein n=1 Tax=Chryseobacterium turcicum TaxID=2898076 RepID=A0A9Q3V5N2_9FLAO|nr:carboxypeptidase-like regulatory domain-containing protein [Chryseobacterium turcicum]MCD1117756.1 carboxypeptidase-like regulatory domain-containing protein [Chryseobacterium turcicum]